MSLELIYTSLSRGLAPGSSGFCTAAATGGMSRQVMGKLEALSGYSFHFNLSDPKANLNPVDYAHTQVRIGSETLSVLSRVAFCGADYSGRTNKIAHHFLLEHGEQLPGGPAWMMRQMAQKIFVAGYSGEPKNLPKRDLRAALPPALGPAGPAVVWQKTTGDAGWAGMLVKAFRENPKVPAFVVFRPGQELLPLFEESLALLPPEERWQVGFATYYTALPMGCQYHWRGVLAGSAAAREMARFPNATVIDLTVSLGRAPDNMFTEAARTGAVLPPVRVAERPRIRVVERAPQPVASVPVAEEVGTLPGALETERRAAGAPTPALWPSPAQLSVLTARARRARWVRPLLAAVILLAVSNVLILGLWLSPFGGRLLGMLGKEESGKQEPTSVEEKPTRTTKAAGGEAETQAPPEVEPQAKPATGSTTAKPTPEVKPPETSQPREEPIVPSKTALPSEKKHFTIDPQLCNKREFFRDAQPTKTEVTMFSGKPQDEKRTTPLSDSESITFLQIPESFAGAYPRLFWLVRSEGAGDTGTLEARVPSGAGSISGDVALATFRVVPGPNGAVLECEIDRDQADHNPNVYNWMVIEVADEHKALHQYYLGPQRPRKEIPLGYSNSGPVKVGPTSFAYPWPDMLTLLVEGKGQQPLLSSGCAKNYHFKRAAKPVSLTIKISEKTSRGKPTEFELGFELSTLGEINTVAKDAAREWKTYQDKCAQAQDILAKAKDNGAKPKPSKQDREDAEKFLEKPPPDKVVKARQTIEAFFGAAETVLEKHGRIRIVDPWEVPVIEVDLQFQRCDPDDLFKHFAPNDNE